MAYTTINKSTAHFNTLLRNGSYAGSGTTAITGVGFAPDLMWEKARSGTSIHALIDKVRGNTKQLRSETNGAETTVNQYQSLDADGFTVSNPHDYGTGVSTVIWNWKAGTTSGLSGGTITPSAYSINTTSKFGIYKYSGTGSTGTIAHGLGATPTFMIFKKTTGSQGWHVYHKSMGNTHEIYLDSTGSQNDVDTAFNDTSPTSTVFTIGTSNGMNSSGEDYIAYVWCDVQGYCATGKYVANGQNDGNFLYTGHKPKFFLLKAYTGGSSSSRNWLLYDDKRDGRNAVDDANDNRSLRPNTDHSEATASGYHIDILSNGVKIRNNSGELNTSGEEYIYFSIGQTIVGTNNIPATGR